MDSDILSSRSSWKVLNVFLEQPWKQFYLRELIKESRISPNTAVKTIKNMEKAGIFTSQRIGNVTSYRINPENEISKKLLLLHHEKRVQSLADEFKVYINRLRRKLGRKRIVSLVLFGSVSKGQAKDTSDVDILVIHEGKIDKEEIRSIFEKYSRYVQIIGFTKNEFDDMYEKGNELIINILKSGVIIYDRDFYYKYLFQPIPRPTKRYIEGILRESEKELEKIWELYRKEKNTRIITPLLYPVVNWLSTALILLNDQIPESRKDVIKRLEKLKENELSERLKITRKIWDGELLEMPRDEIEKLLNLIENKLKECYMKLENTDD